MVALAAVLGACTRPFTAAERAVICQPDSLMAVCTLPADSAILRAVSIDFGPRELASPLLQTLLDKMAYTVQDPSQDGYLIINLSILC